MQMNLRKSLAVAVLSVLPLAGWGAERVTLRNGFALTCDHHGQVENHIRLYLGAGENNFIEFASQEIAGVENVPDVPAPLKYVTGANVAHADDAKLNAADLHEILARAGE